MTPVPLSQQPRGGLGAGVRTEPYPNVVLPVVSLLEFLRRVGKPLQNKWERRNEPRESKRSQASPTAAQDRGCHPNSQHLCLGSCSTLPSLCCTARLRRRHCASTWEGVPEQGAVFPACPCLSCKPGSPEELLPLELDRAEPLQPGSCQHPTGAGHGQGLNPGLCTDSPQLCAEQGRLFKNASELPQNAPEVHRAAHPD